jgi:polysaccharide export outer membrane protein
MLALLAASIASMSVAACSSSSNHAGPGAVSPEEIQQMKEQVGLRPGDALAVAIWREPELSDTIPVNDRGQVVLPLLGPREVQGISPDSLERQLEREYSEYVRSPAVSITALRRISILGSVREPGLYPVDATVTLSDALAMAGGLSPDGDRDGIQLVRGGEVMRESLQASMLVGALPIQSGDQIWVEQRPWLERNWQWLGGTVATFVLWGVFR